MRTGILLLNLGSPDSPSESDVRRYLAQFLMDPYVIDLPWLLRWLVVYGFILPKRPANTAEAYASVWQSEGSPLLIHSRALRDAFSEMVLSRSAMVGERDGFVSSTTLEPPLVYLAMRYGEPSIPSVLASMRQEGIGKVVIVPLYPHYAMSSTRTAVEACETAFQTLRWQPVRRVVKPFYQHPAYIQALATHLGASLEKAPWDHVLFSYHGLPERHLKKTDPTSRHCCRQPSCCDRRSVAHETCYRHQVFRTTALVAQTLGIPAEKYSVSFQSRLGRDKWLEPFTDPHVVGLAQKGIKRLAVVCPAFVADCLETIEEIGEVTKERFLEAGGTSFTLVPCLNAASVWVHALFDIVKPYYEDK